jgi:hypothetical protein
MIRAILLIFDPGSTWERIVKAKRGLGFVLLFYLIPLVAMSVAGELFGKAHFGVMQDYGEAAPISNRLLAVYGAVQFLTSLAVVIVVAVLVKSMAGTFQPRHTYGQCFKVVAYSFGPFFLLRLADAFPVVNPWLSFSVGIIFSQRALYSGIPRVVDPDPPNAFGLYLTSGLLLTMMAGLARFFTLLVLHEKIHINIG